jgi:hypothetical protein
MGQIVRTNSADVVYENGARLRVDRHPDTGRYSWSLVLLHADGTGTFEAMGEVQEVQGVSAGVHQAMVAAAAVFSQIDQDVLEGGSDRA